jgi:hypothetical protein
VKSWWTTGDKDWQKVIRIPNIDLWDSILFLFSLLKMHILIDNDNNCQKGKQ